MLIQAPDVGLDVGWLAMPLARAHLGTGQRGRLTNSKSSELRGCSPKGHWGSVTKKENDVQAVRWWKLPGG